MSLRTRGTSEKKKSAKMPVAAPNVAIIGTLSRDSELDVIS